MKRRKEEIYRDIEISEISNIIPHEIQWLNRERINQFYRVIELEDLSVRKLLISCADQHLRNIFGNFLSVFFFLSVFYSHYRIADYDR